MEVMDIIKRMAKENNQTIVMVTHDKRIAEYADKIIHILDGDIQDIEVVDRTYEEVEKGVEKDNKEEGVEKKV